MLTRVRPARSRPPWCSQGWPARWVRYGATSMTSRCGSISWKPAVARWVCARLGAWRSWPITKVFNRSQMARKAREGTDMKTAVVTGGSSGIGRAVADRLRAGGYHVGTIDLNPSDDEFAQTTDVTDRAQVEAALSAIRAQLGPVGILVNAAGLDGFKRFTDITFEEWQKVVDVNLNGVFHSIQAVLPDMVDAGWGRIVNISSSSTHSGTPYMSHYVAAKSAVNGLTKSLALEYGPEGITVNAVPPGFIDTPMLRSAEKNGFLGDIQATIDATPVRRMGKPEDIAAECAFLISEEAGYITGQILGVNGGRNT